MLRKADFLRDARLDLLEASAWYDRKRDGLGAEFELCVEAAVDEVVRDPKRFAVAFDEIRRATVDRFPYSIYFRLNARQIVVVAVFHNSRDSDQLKTRR